MDKKERAQKRSLINKHIDLTNNKLSVSDINTLFDIVSNLSQYVGKSRTIKRTSDGISSDGKYTRTEETTFTIKQNNTKVYIEEDYRCHDDDGQSGEHQLMHTNGRSIFNALKNFL